MVNNAPATFSSSSEAVQSLLGEVIEQASLIFDPDWYTAQYPDVAAAGIDPAQHFLNTGFSEGRNPNRYFDSTWLRGPTPMWRRTGRTLSCITCSTVRERAASHGRVPSCEISRQARWSGHTLTLAGGLVDGS